MARVPSSPPSNLKESRASPVGSFQHVELDALADVASHDVPLHVDLVVTAMGTVAAAEAPWIVALVLEVALEVTRVDVGLAAAGTDVAATGTVQVAVGRRFVALLAQVLRLVPEVGELAED